MALSNKNGGYAFLIRLDLMFSMSLRKELKENSWLFHKFDYKTYC